MFKSLRDKLKGVSKQLEDELEAQLADRLDAELAAELERESHEKGEQTSSATTPAPEAASAPDPRASTPLPHPAQEETRSEPATDSVPPTDATAPGAAPITPKAEEGPSTDRAAPETVPEPSTTKPAPGGAPSPDAAPAAHEQEGTASTAPIAPATAEPMAPTPAPLTAAPKPAPAQVPGKQAPQKYGKKFLSDEEIERRLLAELDSAVEVQKEVETAVGSAGTVTKFTINEDVLEDILWELEIALLESDVALPVIEAIKKSVKEQLLSLPVAKARPEDIVEKVLRTAIKRVLNVNPTGFDGWLQEKLREKKPVVLMFVGVNGTGKTTSIGRIAYRLQQQGISCVMAAGDTFRAGAIEQLALHGERLGIKVVKHDAGADPAAVAYDAIEHAKARRKDVVLLDTAGRMQNNSNLMDEMDKIRRVANPDLCIFVGDSLAGNDAVEQARKFDEIVDIGGAILTKVDVDAKGGAALSVAYTINKPLLFVGVGQDYPDLRPFDAGWMVDRLFGDEEQPVAA